MSTLAGLPYMETCELTIPHPCKFAIDGEARLQIQTCSENEVLHCRDRLFDPACLFADTRLNVEQEKIAELARNRGKVTGRQPGERHPVQPAQISEQRSAAPFAQTVVEPLQVSIAARFTVFEAAVTKKR